MFQFEIWDSHSGKQDDCSLIPCNLVQGTNVSVEPAPSMIRLEAAFYSEEGGNRFFQNTGIFLSDYMVSHPEDSILYILVVLLWRSPDSWDINT
jgi:hypothetical protein